MTFVIKTHLFKMLTKEQKLVASPTIMRVNHKTQILDRIILIITTYSDRTVTSQIFC